MNDAEFEDLILTTSIFGQSVIIVPLTEEEMLAIFETAKSVVFSLKL